MSCTGVTSGHHEQGEQSSQREKEKTPHRTSADCYGVAAAGVAGDRLEESSQLCLTFSGCQERHSPHSG